ncbi:MAG: shikimate dehydrogenase [Flavobacteriaceae bacterium]|nr:MAG: shikimate dehydrogenase [Flavobacteriaceae bacterium]
MVKRENQQHKEVLFGLVGKNISYSFSKGYFNKKLQELYFENYQYVNFDMENIEDFSEVVNRYKPSLKGMNVTIPYKEAIILYLDEVDKIVREIGAVNTIKIDENGKLKGYNTDVIGFEASIKPLLKEHHTKALILGTGGASKAIAYVFKKLHIEFKFVSRKPKNEREISYQSVNHKILEAYTVLVNCSPVGTYPKLEDCPDIPYAYLTDKHLLYDLIYNPEETLFLAKGKAKGSSVKNGYEMLEKQAEASWYIWNT